MEKQGIIKEGVTPPEQASEDKPKCASVQTPEMLEQDPTRRLIDVVAKETEADND
jgi:hypothetical protein